MAVFSAAIHRGKPSPPLPSELKLLEKVESALSASRPAKKASKRPSTREPAHDKGDMSNLTARREYNKTLEGKVKDLNDQKGAAVVSAHAAEERFRVLLSQKEELAAERARLTETLAVLHVEKKSEADLAAQATRVLEVRVAALEADLADERTKHTPRIEAAEEKAAVLQRERDTLLDDRARLQQQLSSAEAEKRGLEELVGRLEAQLPPLREEKALVVTSLEAAEARCAELQASREVVAEEKARLVEELAVVRAEKRGAEELAKRESQQLEGELVAARKEVAPAEEKIVALGLAKDELVAERGRLSEQLAVLQAEKRRSEDLSRRAESQLASALDDKAAANQRAEAAEERARDAAAAKEAATSERARAEEALAVAVAERKRVEETARMGESKLRDELAAVQAHATFAEQRCHEVSKQREAASDERAKAAEALAVAVSAQRSAEEALAVLVAEKKGVEELASKVEGGLREELSHAHERVKPVEARVHELHRLYEAAQEERHRVARELQHAVAAGRALHEQLQAVLGEKRALEQQLLYVHALTRPPSSAPVAPPFFAPSGAGGTAASLAIGGGGAAAAAMPPPPRPYEPQHIELPSPFHPSPAHAHGAAPRPNLGVEHGSPFIDPVLSSGGSLGAAALAPGAPAASSYGGAPKASPAMRMESPIQQPTSSSSPTTATSVLPSCS